jgi:hypothetical protein
MAMQLTLGDLPQLLVAAIVRHAFHDNGASIDARLTLSLVCKCA